MLLVQGCFSNVFLAYQSYVNIFLLTDFFFFDGLVFSCKSNKEKKAAFAFLMLAKGARRYTNVITTLFLSLANDIHMTATYNVHSWLVLFLTISLVRPQILLQGFWNKHFPLLNFMRFYLMGSSIFYHFAYCLFIRYEEDCLSYTNKEGQ